VNPPADRAAQPGDDDAATSEPPASGATPNNPPGGAYEATPRLSGDDNTLVRPLVGFDWYDAPQGVPAAAGAAVGGDEVSAAIAERLGEASYCSHAGLVLTAASVGLATVVGREQRIDRQMARLGRNRPAGCKQPASRRENLAGAPISNLTNSSRI
jgi:hypothetical protein